MVLPRFVLFILRSLHTPHCSLCFIDTNAVGVHNLAHALLAGVKSCNQINSRSTSLLEPHMIRTAHEVREARSEAILIPILTLS